MQSAGSLKLTSFEDVLRRIATLGQSGLLEVKRGEVIRKFHIENGNLTSCSSNVPGEQLSQLLLWHGMLSEQELRALYAQSKDRHEAFGKTLTGLEIISEEKMTVLLHTKVEDSLIDTMAWEEGRFRFVEADSFYSRSTDIGLSIEDAIQLALKRAHDYKRALSAVPSTQSRFWICVDQEDIESEPQAELLLESLAASLTVEESILELHGRRVFVFSQLAKWLESKKIKIEKRGRNRVQGESSPSAKQFMAEIIKYQNQSELKKAFELCRRALELFPGHVGFSDKLLQVEETYLAKLVRKYLADYRVPHKKTSLQRPMNLDLDANEKLIYRKVDGCWDMLSLVYLVPMKPIDSLLAIDTLFLRDLIAW